MFVSLYLSISNYIYPFRSLCIYIYLSIHTHMSIYCICLGLSLFLSLGFRHCHCLCLCFCFFHYLHLHLCLSLFLSLNLLYRCLSPLCAALNMSSLTKTWKSVAWSDLRTSWRNYWALLGITSEDLWLRAQHAWAPSSDAEVGSVVRTKDAEQHSDTDAQDDMPSQLKVEWQKMMPPMQFAARQLGYSEPSWHAQRCTNTPCRVPPVVNAWSWFVLHSLPSVYRQYWELLGYTDEQWDANGGPTPSGAWEDLTASQQHAAVELGYSKLIWNKTENPDTLPAPLQRILDLRTSLRLSKRYTTVMKLDNSQLYRQTLHTKDLVAS